MQALTVVEAPHEEERLDAFNHGVPDDLLPEELGDRAKVQLWIKTRII